VCNRCYLGESDACCASLLGVPAVDVITSISTHAIAVRSLPTITFTAPPTAISNYARIGFSTSVSCSDLVVVQVFNASQITYGRAWRENDGLTSYIG